MMQTDGDSRIRIERSIAVDTTPLRAYKVLSDPTNIPRYAPDIESVLVTRMTPDLVGTKLTLFTREHAEISGEIVEADMPNTCAFRTESGRTTRWSIEADGPRIRLVNTIETEEPLDPDRVAPELERKLRTLRNAFLQGLRN
jgi:hypothetical protein